MSRDTREILEAIAVDMIAGSMQYMDMTREEIADEARKLTDDELFDFVTEV